MRDARGQLASVAPDQSGTLRGDGWKLRYVSWQADGSTAMPKRIDFTRDTAQSELALRVVIDRWQGEE
jgi:outer membrane biogenesis lipoprotein LolB